MKDKELIRMANEVPYQFWWNIESLIEETNDEQTIEKLRWIMIKKELQERIKTNGL